MTPRKAAKRSRSLPPGIVIILILTLAVIVLGLLLRMEWKRNRAEREVDRFFSSPWVERIKAEEKVGRYSGSFEDYTVRFTLNSKVHDLAVDLLQHYEPVMGIFVAMDAKTGALLAMASYKRKWESCDSGTCPPVFLRPEIRSSAYPMASLVKIVTAAAALESKIVAPDTYRKCRGVESFPGGTVRDPRGVAHGNISIGDALGFSCNAIFSRLGVEVGRERLEEYLDKFMLGRPIGFELPLLESNYVINDTELDVARAGAGFGEIRVSPLHAVAIAAAIQNRGLMMKPYFIESIERAEGSGEDAKTVTIYRGRSGEIARPVKRSTADSIAGMMSATVDKRGGTAYRGFYNRGRYIAKPFKVTGKTGSLDGRTPDEQFTWMIGFVEEGDPKFAFATLVLNDGKWTTKAASFTGQFFKNYAKEYPQ
ncbi:MAG: penicillin-binding transpeptidase domain-containing protein [bacterium]